LDRDLGFDGPGRVISETNVVGLPRRSNTKSAAPEAFVSVVSPWEVAIKAAGGKLRLLEPPVQWFMG
jgi:PIN domain nuclease of toxin-antitoxin system